jgi:hypothetical protein
VVVVAVLVVAVRMTVRMTAVRVRVAVTVLGPVLGYHRVGVDQLRQRLDRPGVVALVLDHDGHGVGQDRRVQFLRPQHGQRAGPVDGLGDAGRLTQFQFPQAADHLHQLGGQRVGQPGLLAAQDLQLPVGVRVVQEQMQAAALERGRQIPGVVGGEQDQRRRSGRERAQLGDGDLVLAQGLQQHRLQGLVRPIDLVDQQDGRFLPVDGLEQRSRRQEPLGEEHRVVLGQQVHR